jgi:hypothetical protein
VKIIEWVWEEGEENDWAHTDMPNPQFPIIFH